MTRKHLILFLLIGFALPSIAYLSFSSEEKDPAYLFKVNKNDGVRSPLESGTEIIQSIEEWNINPNIVFVNSDIDRFNIEMPLMQSGYASYYVERRRYRSYSSGEQQFIGEVFLDSSASESIGTLIANSINGNLYGLLKLQENDYEIYTDSVWGARLARVHSFDLSHDLVPASQLDSLPSSVRSETKETPSIPDVSIIDVLILLDQDFDTSNPLARERVISRKLNGDAVLALSGSDQAPRGVPIEINIVGIDTVNVPSDRERLISGPPATNFEYYVCRGSTSCPNDLNDDIVLKRESFGADLVVLYVEPDDSLSTDPCGQAGQDSPDLGISDRLFTRFSVHDARCTNSQFVFLHEILHNFGVGHEVDDIGFPFLNDLFERYALGVGPDDRPVASIMGCSTFGEQDPPLPNAERTCNRVMRVSDPDEIIENYNLGVEGIADVFRYLTECTIGDQPSNRYRRCPRERIAQTRQAISNNAPPQISIISPSENAPVLNTSPTLLRASALDDDPPLTSVTWSVRKDELNAQTQILQTLTSPGLFNDWRVSTNFFQNTGIGRYFLNATAMDSAGQITTASRELNVVDVVSADISLTLEQFGSDGVAIDITNLGPFTAENVNVEIVHALSGIIYSVDSIQLPDFCVYVPPGPGVECPNSHCESVFSCQINQLQPDGVVRVIQRVCVDGASLSASEVNATVVENLGPVDNNSSNDFVSSSFPTCDSNPGFIE